MASGEVPESLKGKRLISIDLSSLMSGVRTFSSCSPDLCRVLTFLLHGSRPESVVPLKKR